MIFLLLLYFVLYFFPWIENGNETGIPSDVLVYSLSLCGTIISSLKCSPRSPITKALFSVTIEALIVYINGHKTMMLYATPSPREREIVTGFPFTTKGFLKVITVVTSTPPFTSSPYFPPSTPIILNGSTSSRSFKYENFNTKLGWHPATDWWYSRFPKSNPDPVLAKPDMWDDFGLNLIGKFICGSCWDICTNTFDLRRDASNTEILSLCRYWIKCSFRYSYFALLVDSSTSI